MCGRDTFQATWAEVRHHALPLMVDTPADDPEPNYNRAPTQQGWAIVAGDDGGIALPMRWGLLPAWATPGKFATHNARVESCTTARTFRSAWKSRRCIVPSSGYYEWQVIPGGKQPHLIKAADAPMLFFAGLWESRQDEAGGELLSYTILTRDADPCIAPVHDRMPLALPSSLFHDWIHGTPDDAAEILHAAPEPDLMFHPVGSAVGNVRNRGAELMAPI